MQARKLVVDCAAWGARAYQEEADAWRLRAEGEEGEARARSLAQAEACDTAGRNALISAGLPPDEPAVPETWVDLTPAEVAQRTLDAEAAVTHAWEALRAHRNALLATSDWTQLPDATLTPQQRAAWDEYRRALRDVPAVTTDPHDPAWPAPPER